jgi:Helix-turn-helix domain
MDNEQEIIPIWRDEKPKSIAKMILNENQKRTNIQNLISQMDKSRLRPKLKPSRFFMENEYVHGGYVATLPNSCTRIYLVLSVHCNNNKQIAFPSITKIQEMSGCTNRNTTVKALSILESYGIIGKLKTKGFNMVNVYSFQDTKYWKPIPSWKEKLEQYNNKSQYQFIRHRSNKKPDYRSNRDDTLTNLSDNSPNKLTTIGDVLRGRMQEWQIPEKVAIQEPSGDTVVGLEGKEVSPVNTGEIRGVSAANATQMQRHRSNTSDTTINEEKSKNEVTNNMGHRIDDPNIKSAYE